jgi:hypothetical protein
MSATSANADRRRSPRVTFIAHGEVWEENPEGKVRMQVSEISLHGCYLDMVNPAPRGTKVVVNILEGAQPFTVAGRVIYSQPHLRMGVEFQDVPPNCRSVLEAWHALRL